MPTVALRQVKTNLTTSAKLTKTEKNISIIHWCTN